MEYHTNSLPKNNPMYPPIFPTKEWLSTAWDWMMTLNSSGYWTNIPNSFSFGGKKGKLSENEYSILVIAWHGDEKNSFLTW